MGRFYLEIMATYLELLALAQDANFQRRVQFAMYKSAGFLKGLPGATTQEKLWADRVFKHSVAAEPLEVATRISVDPAILTNGANCSDQDIQGAVDAVRTTLTALEV